MKTKRTKYHDAATKLLDNIDKLTAAVKQHAQREANGLGGIWFVDDVQYASAKVRELIDWLDARVG